MTRKVKMPDPIGHISVTTGGVTVSYLTNKGARSVRSGDTLITTTQAEAYANDRVREALEEAANRVADPVNIEASIENFAWGSHGNYERAHFILQCAVKDIRALIPKEPPCET